jgi:hypothetical protein
MTELEPQAEIQHLEIQIKGTYLIPISYVIDFEEVEFYGSSNKHLEIN